MEYEMHKSKNKNGVVMSFKNMILAIFLCGLSTIVSSKSILEEDFSQITIHEDQLLEKYYPQFGKGLYPHATNEKPDTASQFNNIPLYLPPINDGVTKGIRLYKEIMLPMIDKHFPALHNADNEAYKYFLKKSYAEFIRNIVFADVTALMHKSDIPDKANTFFAASHPYYDAIFDVDWEDAKGIYTRLDLVKRVSQIIQRDYNLPKPILPIEKMVIEITKGLENSLPPQNVETFFDELYKLNVAQIDSVKQQMVPNIAMEDLRKTTFKKGGLSMTLYALLADHHFTRKELDIYFLEGAFLQNLDDMNDIVEDAKEGGVTLAGSYLITPFELDKMTEVWFKMLDEQVENNRYDATAVKGYKITIDQFLNASASAFNKHFNAEKTSKQSFLKRATTHTKNGLITVAKYPFILIGDIAAIGLKYPIPALRIKLYKE
jgi:hypothetical protein